MNEFVKSIKIKFDPDKETYNKIKQDLDKLEKFNLFSDKEKESLADEISKMQAVEDELNEIEKSIELLAGLDNEIANKARKKLQKEADELRKELGKQTSKNESLKEVGKSVESIFGEFGDTLAESDSKFTQITGKFISGFGKAFKVGSELISGNFDSLGDILSSSLKSLASLLADGWDELENILSFSKLSNQNTRDLVFQYGFSSSEAYGYSKAMDILGYNSMDDLYYALTTSQQEANEFYEAFEKYSSKYTKLYDSGMFQQMQEFNVEMADFQEELKLEIVDFYMNNKDTIKTAMRAIINLAEFTISALGEIIRLITPQRERSESERAAATASIINSYSTSTNSPNTNISIDNTFNNVAKADQNWLSNAGQMTYEQIIKALG